MSYLICEKRKTCYNMKSDRCHHPTLSACTVGFNGTLAKTSEMEGKNIPHEEKLSMCVFFCCCFNVEHRPVLKKNATIARHMLISVAAAL